MTYMVTYVMCQHKKALDSFVSTKPCENTRDCTSSSVNQGVSCASSRHGLRSERPTKFDGLENISCVGAFSSLARKSR